MKCRYRYLIIGGGLAGASAIEGIRHLDTTNEEVTARLNQNWTGDVTSYDKLHLEILKMAEMLSSGIVRQFPQRFEK
jgi:hypothetical protein